MLFSKARRDKLSEVDARWPLKIGVRMLLNLICVFSIICAVFTVTHNSKFNSKPFNQARAVLVYVPCVRQPEKFLLQSLIWAGWNHDRLEHDKHHISLGQEKGIL